MLWCNINAVAHKSPQPQEKHHVPPKPEDFTKSGFNFALFYANTTFEGIERLAH